jgi:hypothetical protein
LLGAACTGSQCAAAAGAWFDEDDGGRQTTRNRDGWGAVGVGGVGARV